MAAILPRRFSAFDGPRQNGPVSTFYDEIGGEETFRRIVARFYEGVATDPVLRPLYPEEDLGPAEERFRLFLIQYWGGPDDVLRHPRPPAAADAARAVRRDTRRRAALARALPGRARRRRR